MKLLLEPEIYKWLTSLKILPINLKHIMTSNGKYEIDEVTTKNFENGKIFSEIIKNIFSMENKPFPKTLDNLKDQNTPAARLYNWNVLYENMKQLGFTLDQDLKSLLVSGDVQIINEFLKDIYESISIRLEKMSAASSVKSTANYELNLNRKDGIVKMNRKDNLAKKDPNTINMNEIDIEKPLDECESLLEFLLILLSKNLNLKPKQSAALLTNNNKYLAHLLIKGLKGDFAPLLSLLQAIYLNLSLLLNLLLPHPPLLPLFLQIIKPALLSRSPQITLWGLRIFSQFLTIVEREEKSDQNITKDKSSNNFADDKNEKRSNINKKYEKPKSKRDLKNNSSHNDENGIDDIDDSNKSEYDFRKDKFDKIFKKTEKSSENAKEQKYEIWALIFEWFAKENGGWSAFILSIKRHSGEEGVREGVGEVLGRVGRGREAEVWGVELRKCMGGEGEYAWFVREMAGTLMESGYMKEKLIECGVIDLWFEITNSCFSKEESESKILALDLMTDLWIYYPGHVEESSDLSDLILTLLKKGTRDRSDLVVNSSIAMLFKLLDYFASVKNSFAPIIFKTLTFSCIENHANVGMREIFLRNFSELFYRFQSIPINILLEPLIKQIQVGEKNYVINVFDMEFLLICAEHAKITIKMVILLFDLLIKIYYNNIVFSQIARKIMLHLMKFHIESEPFNEYLQKTQDISVSLLLSNEKQRKIPPKKYPSEFKESDVDTFNSQQRALIIEFLRDLIGMNNETLIEQIKPLLLDFYQEIKNLRGEKHSGAIMLLALCGVDQVDGYYENEENSLDEQNIEVPKEIEDEANILNDEDLFVNRADKASNLPKISLPNTPDKNLTTIGETSPKKEEKSTNKKSSSKNQLSKKKEGENLNEMFENDQLLFIEKHGLGLKDKNDNNMSINNSKSKPRLIRANSKAVEELEKIRLKKLEEKLQKQMKEEEKKLKEEMVKKKLREQIKKKNLVLGIANQTESISLLSDLTGQNKLLNEITYIDFGLEEDRDLETVSLVLSQNKHLMKYLFSKYSNSTHSKKSEFFGELQEKFENITLSDLLKMLKDVHLANLITKEESQHLIKTINMKLKNKESLNGLDYEGFSKFLVQLCLNRYAGKDKAIRSEPAGFILREFLEIFKNHHLQKGEYKEEEMTEEMNMLNKKLAENENYELPEKYKKFHEKSVNFNYKIPINLLMKIPPSYVTSYSIISDLCKQIFGFHLVEPNTACSFVPKVKSINEQPKKKQKRVVSEEPSVIMKIDETKSETAIGKGQINSIKLLKAQKASIDKSDLLSPAGQRRENSSKSHVLPLAAAPKSKLFEEKILQQKEEEEKAREKELKRKQRQEELDMQMRELKERKKEVELAQALEEKKRKEMQEEDEKKIKDRQRKRMEKNKERLKDFKTKQEDAKEKQVLEEKEVHIKKQEEKKKEVEEFLKKQNEKLKNDFDHKKKEREKSVQNQIQTEILNKEKEAKRKEKVYVTLEKEREKRELEKNSRKKIFKLYQTEPFQDLFKKYHDRLNNLYNFYVLNTELKLDVNYSRENMQFKGFMNFASHFKLYPEILTSEAIQLIYRSITKDKTIQNNVPIGITYEEFQLSLLRIALKEASFFEKLSDKDNNQTQDKEIQKLILDQKNKLKSEEERKDNYEEILVDKSKIDEYRDIEDMNVKDLEGLFIYLDLPEDKSKLNNKIRDIITEYSKVVAPREKKKVLSNKLNSTEEKTINIKKKPVSGSHDRKNKFDSKVKIERSNKENKTNNEKNNIKLSKAEETKKQSKEKSKDRLQSVSLEELKKNDKQTNKNYSLNIVAPGGKKENWAVNSNEN